MPKTKVAIRASSEEAARLLFPLSLQLVTQFRCALDIPSRTLALDWWQQQDASPYYSADVTVNRKLALSNSLAGASLLLINLVPIREASPLPSVVGGFSDEGGIVLGYMPGSTDHLPKGWDVLAECIDTLYASVKPSDFSGNFKLLSGQEIQHAALLLGDIKNHLQ